MNERLLAMLIKLRTDLGKCIHLYDKTQGNKETQALLTENCLRQVQENRETIIKEEASKKTADKKLM